MRDYGDLNALGIIPRRSRSTKDLRRRSRLPVSIPMWLSPAIVQDIQIRYLNDYVAAIDYNPLPAEDRMGDLGPRRPYISGVPNEVFLQHLESNRRIIVCLP